MNRRNFIKTIGITSALGGLAGCNSVIHRYYEPNLSELDKLKINYKNLLENKIRLVNTHEKIIDRFGAKITSKTDFENGSQEITYRKDTVVNHSLFQKTSNVGSSPKEVLDRYSNVSATYQRIQRKNEETDYSVLSNSGVYLYSGASTLLSWMDSSEIKHTETNSMNGTKLHQYKIQSFDGEPVSEGFISVNDRGVILEFVIKTEGYKGTFSASNFNSISFEKPVWVSTAKSNQ